MMLYHAQAFVSVHWRLAQEMTENDGTQEILLENKGKQERKQERKEGRKEWEGKKSKDKWK